MQPPLIEDIPKNDLTRRQWNLVLVLCLSPFVFGFLLDLINPLYERLLFAPFIGPVAGLNILIAMQSTAFTILFSGFQTMNARAHRNGCPVASRLREVIFGVFMFVVFTAPALLITALLPGFIFIMRSGVFDHP